MSIIHCLRIRLRFGFGIRVVDAGVPEAEAEGPDLKLGRIREGTELSELAQASHAVAEIGGEGRGERGVLRGLDDEGIEVGDERGEVWRGC